MEIFAVLRETGGGHESCDVMSVWSTQELAQKEVDRLNAGATSDYQYEIRKWELDVAGDVINW